MGRGFSLATLGTPKQSCLLGGRVRYRPKRTRGTSVQIRNPSSSFSEASIARVCSRMGGFWASRSTRKLRSFPEMKGDAQGPLGRITQKVILYLPPQYLLLRTLYLNNEHPCKRFITRMAKRPGSRASIRRGKRGGAIREEEREQAYRNMWPFPRSFPAPSPAFAGALPSLRHALLTDYESLACG